MAGMGQDYTHNKIVFKDTIFKPVYYSDHYRFGNAEAKNKPLVFYMGGR